MSVFDQPYYALTKAHMSRMGIWPEQSKYVRIIRPTTIFFITLTLIGPVLIRLHDVWRDINILVKLSLTKIEEHWDMFKNTPAVIVLDKYAERGRYIVLVYTTYCLVMMILFSCLCLSPIILDFVDPMNETRAKIYVVEAEYGVDADKYYWFIIAHTYVVMTMMISMMVAIVTMYILCVVHACALFEVVGFNLELAANEYTMNPETAITLRRDTNIKKICDCISFHVEAISFANLIEDVCSGANGAVLAIIAIIIVISGVQALINWKHPELLVQQITLIIGQVLHLYIISIPGQELMNHSEKIHTTAYNLDWQNMSAIAQKLLILILIRSNKPCYFTAGKVFVLSLETFGSAIRTVVSYFMIFAQMIQ